MADFTADEVGYFARHLFLPPRLPEEDDSTASYDNALLRLVQQALANFFHQLDSEPNQISRIMTSAISHLVNLRDSDGSLHGPKLAEALESLANVEGGKSSCPCRRIQLRL